MILVCGAIADTVTELVCARLVDCGFDFRLVDLGRFPRDHAMDVSWSSGRPEGVLAGPGWRLDLRDIDAVFARWPGPETRAGHAELEPQQRLAAMSECDGALMDLLEELPCLVMNRVAGGLSNHSKPLQALAIERAGLATPRTLVTTDPDAARDFVQSLGGAVIYKSISGVRSIVRRVGKRQLARLALVRHGPCQLQEYLPGRNVRVHTVGDALFATAIVSDSVDYRYASRERKSAALEPTDLPADIAAACRRLARRLGLVLSGIDLKQTPDGRWYCFEINPAPGFIYYERATGQPISLAVAELLQSRSRAPSPAASVEA